VSERHGGDKRGCAASRRARKLWMLSPEAPWGGDGTYVPCVHCLAWLDYFALEADRIVPGGSYRRTNIQPSCGPCNKARSDNPVWQYQILARQPVSSQ
jgi:hypothetical protein